MPTVGGLVVFVAEARVAIAGAEGGDCATRLVVVVEEGLRVAQEGHLVPFWGGGVSLGVSVGRLRAKSGMWVGDGSGGPASAAFFFFSARQGGWGWGSSK